MKWMKRLFKESIPDPRALVVWLFLFGLVLGFGLPAKSFGNSETYVSASIGDDSYDGSSPTKGTFPAGPKKTIQAGIDVTDADGTCYVAAGNYNESIYIDKGVDLVGEELGQSMIDATGIGDITTDAVTFDGNATVNASISKFTITRAKRNGVRCRNGAEPEITNNTITENNSSGIVCYSSSPTITNNTITGNLEGNGIYCWKSSPDITNNIITGNDYPGIYCENSSPDILNNAITGNNSSGIACSSSSPTITNNIITGNLEGNGIYCWESSPDIINNIITENTWPGIYCEDFSEPNITNNTITGNEQTGIYCGNSSPDITNNIIVSNNTSGIYADGPSSPVISHNDVWDNSPDYDGCSAGPDDISDDPLFVDSSNSDFHLQNGSPCIDKGTNTPPGDLPSTDKDGKVRISPPAGKIDIGAYEYQKTGPISEKDIVFNYPNPVRADEQEYTTFKFYCEDPQKARIDIYDLSYELVESLSGPYDGPTIDGYYKKDWSIVDIARGVYVYIFYCGDEEPIVKKVMVVK